MRSIALAVLSSLLAAPAFAQNDWAERPRSARESPYVLEPSWTSSPAPVVRKKKVKKSWEERARFFGGARGSVGVAPGGEGAAPTAGMELGVVVDEGFGLGLHLIWANRVPGAPSLNVPAASWAVGAAANLRWYFQTVRPLTLYPSLSVGFLGGPARDTGLNAVLPMFNPGFGARIRLGQAYVSFEFGAVGLQIPFIAIALGWEPDRPVETEDS